MNPKIKKQLILLDLWEIEELEAWFSDMARQGWKLIELGKMFAVFEQCEPQQLKFRCDIFKLNLSGQDRIDFYEQAGWKYVDSRHYVHVFREKEPNSALEIHTDPEEHAETMALLKNSIFIRGLATVILSIFIIVLNLSTLQMNSIDIFLTDRYIGQVFTSLVYIWVICYMVSGMFHISKLIKKLKKGQLLEHRKSYQKKMKIRKACFTILVVSFLVFLSFSIFTLITTLTEDRFPEIPDHSLSTLEIEDIYFNEQYQYATAIFEGGDYNNYFKQSSSLLVPEQYELRQRIEIPTKTWSDSTDTYSPSIWSNVYVLRNDWLASRLVAKIIEKDVIFSGEFERKNDQRFDELWINNPNKSNYFIIARKNNTIHYITYFGEQPIEKLIDEVSKKID